LNEAIEYRVAKITRVYAVMVQAKSRLVAAEDKDGKDMLEK
jgi:hypothetical protein